MENYKSLINDVLQRGRYKMDRTGTGCYSLFGAQMRFDLSKGFPLVTLKATSFTPIAKEILWFIAGGTNIHDPQFEGCRFWDEWALQEDVVKITPYTLDELLDLAARREGVTASEMTNRYRALLVIETQARGQSEGYRKARELIRNAAGVVSDYREKVVAKAGDIGPMYGRQWRNFNGVDQLKEAIELLRHNPASRRVVVSAWNPSVLPDPKLSPTENVAEGNAALAACHTLFQFYAELLTEEERLALLADRYPVLESSVKGLYDHAGDFKDPGSREHLRMLGQLADKHIPEYRLSCMLTARRPDCALRG